jgi:hypothetical protein
MTVPVNPFEGIAVIVQLVLSPGNTIGEADTADKEKPALGCAPIGDSGWGACCLGQPAKNTVKIRMAYDRFIFGWSVIGLNSAKFP